MKLEILRFFSREQRALRAERRAERNRQTDAKFRERLRLVAEETDRLLSELTIIQQVHARARELEQIIGEVDVVGRQLRLMRLSVVASMAAAIAAVAALLVAILK